VIEHLECNPAGACGRRAVVRSRKGESGKGKACRRGFTPFVFRLSPFLSLALAVAVGCDKPSPPPAASATPEPDSAVAAEAPPAAAEPAPERTLDKTFDDLKFDIEPDAAFDRSMLTDEIRALDDRRLRIRGYMLPTAQKRGIRQFVLVRDNQECCFGPGAALYDCILVTMRGDETAEFSVRPIAVEGVFTIDEFLGPGGRPLAIYRLAGETVR